MKPSHIRGVTVNRIYYKSHPFNGGKLGGVEQQAASTRYQEGITSREVEAEVAASPSI